VFEIEINRDLHDEYEFEYRMVVENEIPPFLSSQIKNVDCRETLAYYTESMTNLKELADRNPLKYMELCMLIDSLDKARYQAREYLLSVKGIILTPESIFYDSFNKQIRFAYNPGREIDEYTSYTELTEFLLTAVDYSDEEAVKLAYALYAAVLNKDYEFRKYADMEKYRAYIEKANQKSEKTYQSPENKDVYMQRVKQKDEINQLPHLSYLSVICITLLVVVGTLAGTVFIINPRLLIRIINSTKHLTTIVLVLALLVYFPIINISDIRRARRIKNKK